MVIAAVPIRSQTRLQNCALLLCNKLPFAALPLIVNVVVWSVVRRVTGWPVFAVEDLAYFAIMVAGETTLMAWIGERRREGKTRSAQPFLFAGPIVVVFIASIVLAKWHTEGRSPGADQLFDPQFWVYIGVVGACAAFAVVGAVANLLLSTVDPREIPSMGELVCGRCLFAVLPVVATAVVGLLDGSPQLFRPSDVCFFSIAICGPAVLDLVHTERRPATWRGVWSVFPMALMVWSSMLLGFWYFIRIMPISPVNDHASPGTEMMIAVKGDAIISAVLSFIVGISVNLQLLAPLRVLHAAAMSDLDTEASLAPTNQGQTQVGRH